MTSTERTKASHFELTQPAPGIVCTVVRGEFQLKNAITLMARVDPLIASGVRPIIFHDWEKLESYEAESRDRLVKWVLKMSDHIGGVHMLVGSRIIAMALSVANMTMKGFITGYTSRAQFELVRDRAIAASS